MRSARAAVFLGALAGCPLQSSPNTGPSGKASPLEERAAKTAPNAELVWSYDYPGYFGPNDFADGSYFSPAGVLISKQGRSAGLGDALVSLDPNDGTVLWTTAPAQWVLHPPNGLSPLFVINRGAPEDTARAFAPYRELRELNPTTGVLLRRVPINPIRSSDTRFFFAHKTVFAIFGGTLRAIDPKSGQTRWERTVDVDPSWPPLLLPGRVIFQGAQYMAYDLNDGQKLFQFQGKCCAAFGTHNGKHVYVQSAANTTAELAADGRVVRTLEGVPSAISDAFIALERRDTDTSSQQLSVVPHDDPAPVLVLETTESGEYYSAVTLHEDRLFAFHSKDASVSSWDARTGERQVVLRLSSHFVLSPDATGTASPHLTAAPIYTPPLFFINDWSVRAYRLPQL